MRTGLILPISNNALAFAFFAALIFTVLWLIYHALMHSSKNQTESSFNKTSSPSDRLSILDADDISDLLLKFPNRIMNVDAETKIFWSSEIPLSIAIAQANTQSPLKLYIRINYSARELGHKISISSDDEDAINLQLTAESLIFSDNEKSFYPINSENFQKLHNILGGQKAFINKKIPIPQDDSMTLCKSIDKIIQIHASNSQILLLGE